MARMKLESRRGISVIEGTLMIPILTLLTFTSIEFGTMLHIRHTMLHAAREGARTLAVRDGTVQDAKQAAYDLLPSNNFDWVVDATPAMHDWDRDVEVEISVPFAQAAAGDTFGFFGDDRMRVVVTMRNEE